MFSKTKLNNNLLKRVITTVTVIFVLVATLPVFLSRHNLIFDLFSHFQLQYTVVATLWLTALMFIKFRTSIKVLFPISLITLQLIISIILITPFQIAPKPLQNSDIYFMNTNVYNENYTEILEYIKKYNPQKVALVEVRIEIIDKIKENYGEPVTYINGGAYSCAIFSREKPIKTEPIQVETYPICKAVFEDYTLLVIHPYPPLTHESYSSQKEYFSQIQNELEHLRQNGENFVLVGDFNSTIYSGVFRKYFGEYHNVNHYTWNPKSPLALPIDHGLSNLPIETSKGDKLSSDHTGLFIKLLD